MEGFAGMEEILSDSALMSRYVDRVRLLGELEANTWLSNKRRNLK